jgi:TRAP-type mannitol/chloroaromatic compound transport system permease small subunit
MDSELVHSLGRSLQFIGWAFLPILVLPFLVFTTGRFIGLSQTLISMIDHIISALGEIIKWVMPLMVMSVVLAVIALSIYGVSSIWWDESAIYLHAMGICLGVAPTYLAAQHVKVDIFYYKFTQTTRALVEICGFYGLLLPVCMAVIWRSQSFVSFAWQSFEGSSNSQGVQGVYILKTALMVMFILLLLQGLSSALRAAMTYREVEITGRAPHSNFAFLHKPSNLS